MWEPLGEHPSSVSPNISPYALHNSYVHSRYVGMFVHYFSVSLKGAHLVHFIETSENWVNHNMIIYIRSIKTIESIVYPAILYLIMIV